MFEHNANVKIILTLQRDGVDVDSFSLKAVVDIINVTVEGFDICVTAISAMGRLPHDSLSAYWLALAEDESWVQSGQLGLSRHLDFLDGKCHTVTDERASLLKEPVLIPASGLLMAPESSHGFQRGALRWIEKFDGSRFSFCTQRVVSNLLGANDAVKYFADTYLIVSAVEEQGVVTTGHVSIPPWSPGRNCAYVSLRPRETTPFIFIGLEYPIALGNAYSSDAAIAWVSNMTSAGFSLCVEEVREFWQDEQAFRSEATAHWVAVYT